MVVTTTTTPQDPGWEDLWPPVYCLFIFSSGLSGIMCLGAFIHLMRLKSIERKSLFWMQLVVLLCIDFTASMWVGTHSVLCSLSDNAFDDFCHPNPDNPDRFWSFLDDSACIMELEMAIGFALACYGSQRWTLALQIAVPAGLVIVALWVYYFNGILVDDEDDALSWGGFVLGCFGLTIGVYMIGACWVANQPHVFRRRAFIRGFTYVACAFVCLMPNAFFAVFPEVEPGPAALVAAHTAYLLSGAIKAGCYAFWTRTSGTNSRRHESFGEDLCQNESFVLNVYFNLGAFEDPATYEAARLAAEAVADLRDVLNTAEAEITPMPRIQQDACLIDSF